MLSRTAGTLFTTKPYTIVQYFGVSEPYHTPKIGMAERAKCKAVKGEGEGAYFCT